MISRGMLAGILTLLIGGAAHAGTLTTPLVDNFSVEIFHCVLTNVGTGTSTITSIQLFNVLGAEITPDSNSCGATLAPHASCAVQKDPGFLGAYCTATASGKIRLSLSVLSNSTGETMVTVSGTP